MIDCGLRVGAEDFNGMREVSVMLPDENEYTTSVALDSSSWAGPMIAQLQQKLSSEYGKPFDYSELREALVRQAEVADAVANGKSVEKFKITTLFSEYRTMKPSVLDGLVRRGETANLVSLTKMGKSWLMYYILLCIALGRSLFDKYECSPGRVLLVDNELHKPTLASRISTVASAMGVFVSDYGELFDVWPLRGNLQTLPELIDEFSAIESGYYQAIAFDARYRFAVDGESENDNARQALFYNDLDRIAAQTDAALFLVHHSTKGSQSEKRITDVGAGGGSQSRAADSHLILREHEQEGHIVFDAAVRSFPPVEPMVLKWEFPLWVPTDEDPLELKGSKSKSEDRQRDRDREATRQILSALMTEPATASQIREKTALSRDRAQRLLNMLMADGQIEATEVKVRGNLCKLYQITNQDVVGD